jgi:putative ABC transport system permease protein
MRWFDRLRFRTRSLVRRRRAERELEQELQFHLDQQTEENRLAGMSAEAARTSARAIRRIRLDSACVN